MSTGASAAVVDYRGGLRVTRQQAAVVDHVVANPVTVVGAGAGSGKTHTTAATVLDLLDSRSVPIDAFVLITFTNNAADELRERMESLLRERVARAANPADVAHWRAQQERLSAAFVGTIHGFCRGILRTYGYEALLAREADVTLSRALLHQAIEDSLEWLLRQPMPFLLGDQMRWEEFHLAKRVREVLETARNAGLRPRDVLERTEAQPDDPGKPYRTAMAWLVWRTEERYAALKQERQVLDSNDLLRETADLLTQPAGSRVLDRLGRRYRYLFVDEFQDTDEVQKRIVDAFRGRLQGIMVVGDRKQSIYGFRGAAPSLLDRIAKENGVTVLPLNVSRRPTRALLQAQNVLFHVIGGSYSFLRDPLEPWEGAADGPTDLPPMVYVSARAASAHSATPDDRIRATAACIRRLLSREIIDRRSGALRRTEPGDVVVLVRTHRHLQAYASGLRDQLYPDVDVRPDTGGQFYRQPEIVATYRMLLLLLDSQEDMVLSMALETPYLRDAEPRAMEQRLLQFGSRENTPLNDWLETTCPRYYAALEDLRRAVRVDTVPQLLGRLYETFDIHSFYLGNGNQQAVANLEKLREVARSWFNNEQALTLRQFVGGLRQLISAERDEAEAALEVASSEERSRHIRVMIIHRAKGLEFPIVIIPELQAPLDRSGDPELQPTFLISPEDGLDIQLPAPVRTASPRFEAALHQDRHERIEEEMRTFYVAVTRAEQSVLMVGSGPPYANSSDSRYYSWKDEVLQARTALEGVGAVFIFQQPSRGSR
jgi:DNA helicase-2/ATP-dependent DNA helicase PcrA